MTGPLADLDPWDRLAETGPDPRAGGEASEDGEAGADSDPDSGARRYRGRRRQSRAGRRAALVGSAAVVGSVAAILIGSGVLANYLSDPVTLPVVPPSPSVSAVPTGSATPSPDVSQLGQAPTPSASPSPEPPPPSPSPPPPPPEPPPPPPPPPPAGPVDVSLEAEAGDLGGMAQIRDLESASGGQAVRLFGWCECHTVTFESFTVDRADEYQLTIQHGRFEFEDRFDRTARLVVNGDVRVLALESPRRGDVRSVTLTIELREGRNTIEITGTSNGFAPNVDLIRIVEAPD